MSFFGAGPPEESKGEKYHKQPDPNAKQSDLPLNEGETQFVATPENTGKTTRDIKATAQPSSYWDMTTSVGNYMLSFVISPTPSSNNEAPLPPALKTLPSTLLPLELKDGTKLESSTVQLAYRCFYKEKPMQELQDQLPSSVARRETKANPQQQGKLIDPEDTTPLIVQKRGAQGPYEEIWGLDSAHHFIHVTTSEVRAEDLVKTIQKHELALAFQNSDVPNHLKERFYRRAISSEHLQEIQSYEPVMDRDAFQENLNATLRTMALVERLIGRPLSDQMFEECFFALLDPTLRATFENSVHQLDQIYVKNGHAFTIEDTRQRQNAIQEIRSQSNEAIRPFLELASPKIDGNHPGLSEALCTLLDGLQVGFDQSKTRLLMASSVSNALDETEGLPGLKTMTFPILGMFGVNFHWENVKIASHNNYSFYGEYMGAISNAKGEAICFPVPLQFSCESKEQAEVIFKALEQYMQQGGLDETRPPLEIFQSIWQKYPELESLDSDQFFKLFSNFTEESFRKAALAQYELMQMPSIPSLAQIKEHMPNNLSTLEYVKHGVVYEDEDHNLTLLPPLIFEKHEKKKYTADLMKLGSPHTWVQSALEKDSSRKEIGGSFETPMTFERKMEENQPVVEVTWTITDSRKNKHQLKTTYMVPEGVLASDYYAQLPQILASDYLQLVSRVERSLT